jgi:perosamine synthetase
MKRLAGVNMPLDLTASASARKAPGPIPYSRQWVDDDDIAAVVSVLRGDWLTTGPMVAEFEKQFAAAVGGSEAVAVNSGTAALHAMLHALELKPGDEVIVPSLTFAATANAVLYVGATPVFADVVADTLLIDPDSVAERITPRTRAIVAVDYAGQPCDYDRLQAIADRHGLVLLADACHSLGGSWRGRSVGTLARLSAFSFHPVKPITTAEGGMVTTGDPQLADRMRTFRNHGIVTDHRQRELQGTWFYEMHDLGFNYRLNDVQCALGISQLRRLPEMVNRRRSIAEQYDRAFQAIPAVLPIKTHPLALHARHLYVVRWRPHPDGLDRAAAFRALRAAGILANVHYVPVHLHPYYRLRLGTRPGMSPVAEAAYEEVLSLPIFPRMSDQDVQHVVAAVLSLAELSRMAA